MVSEPGTLQAWATLSFTPIHTSHVEECPDIGPACATTPLQPYQHDQHLYVSELDASLAFGLVKHLAFEATFGVRQVIERIDYLDLAGNAYTPPVPDVHHRNETLTGPIDPWLMLHAGTSLSGFAVGARGGVTLPLGSTVVDPFRLGDLGLPHEHIQFGTGTFDPLVGVEVERRFTSFSVRATELSRLVLGANGYGYRAGNRHLVTAQAESGLTTRDWSFQGGLDLFREEPETWGGVQHEEGNIGRTDLLLDLGAVWRFSRPASANLSLKLPLVTHAQGAQVSYPAIIAVGISAQLGP